MKRIIFNITMALSVGIFVLFTGCEKKSTVVIRNNFPQRFIDVKGELMSNAEFNINEAIIDKIEGDSVQIHLKGQVEDRNLLSELMLTGYELDYKVYDSSGKEVKHDSPDKEHIIKFRCNLQGEIDSIAIVYLGSEPDSYTVEFLESNYERVFENN